MNEEKIIRCSCKGCERPAVATCSVRGLIKRPFCQQHLVGKAKLIPGFKR